MTKSSRLDQIVFTNSSLLHSKFKHDDESANVIIDTAATRKLERLDGAEQSNENSSQMHPTKVTSRIVGFDGKCLELNNNLTHPYLYEHRGRLYCQRQSFFQYRVNRL